MIKEYITDDKIKEIIIENDSIRVTVLPEIGGKISKIESKNSGRQFLLPPQNNDGKYKKAFPGAPFDQYDTSGFDECFPTVEPADLTITNGNGSEKNIKYPDHGELWSRTWDYSIDNENLIMEIDGDEFDYHFKKVLSLEKGKLNIDYTVVNNSKYEFCYIWAAHPLLDIDESSEIILPDDIDEVLVNWSSDEKLGKYGDILKWPALSTNGLDFDGRKIYNTEHRTAVKLFTEKLNKIYGGLYHKNIDEHIMLGSDSENIPYLGLWFCYGGWPENSNDKHHTIGIEPTNGKPDSLTEAYNNKTCSMLKSGDSDSWNMYIEIGKGKPNNY